MSKIYIGIDPGASGFFSVYKPHLKEWSHYEMPKIGKFVDVKELAVLFENICNMVVHKEDLIIGMEDVHAIHGSSAKSTFSFGYVCGLIEGLIVANKLPFIKIQPKKWQSQMWAGIPNIKKPSSTGKTLVNDTKAMSLMAASRLFPNMDFRRSERCETPDNNKVDSILICEYMKRNY